ncbi:hypothetical protein BDY24DRAFT_75401 [Mrakia frigida]|uniref:uncharacterized protein n=1 Tax=Mrakia frigida TaxID=29902 RepID=UPI003FCC0028
MARTLLQSFWVTVAPLQGLEPTRILLRRLRYSFQSQSLLHSTGGGRNDRCFSSKIFSTSSTALNSLSAPPPPPRPLPNITTDASIFSSATSLALRMDELRNASSHPPPRLDPPLPNPSLPNSHIQPSPTLNLVVSTPAPPPLSFLSPTSTSLDLNFLLPTSTEASGTLSRLSAAALEAGDSLLKAEGRALRSSLDCASDGGGGSLGKRLSLGRGIGATYADGMYNGGG